MAIGVYLVEPPSVSGTVRVGATVRAVAGSWQPAATSDAYQWLASGTVIPGATGSSYVIPASVRGRKLAARVTAKRANRDDTVVPSAATVVACGPAPTVTKRPAVSGTVKASRSVTATVGEWSPAATGIAQRTRHTDGKATSAAVTVKK